MLLLLLLLMMMMMMIMMMMAVTIITALKVARKAHMIPQIKTLQCAKYGTSKKYVLYNSLHLDRLYILRTFQKK